MLHLFKSFLTYVLAEIWGSTIVWWSRELLTFGSSKENFSLFKSTLLPYLKNTIAITGTGSLIDLVASLGVFNWSTLTFSLIKYVTVWFVYCFNHMVEHESSKTLWKLGFALVMRFLLNVWNNIVSLWANTRFQQVSLTEKILWNFVMICGCTYHVRWFLVILRRVSAQIRFLFIRVNIAEDWSFICLIKWIYWGSFHASQVCKFFCIIFTWTIFPFIVFSLVHWHVSKLLACFKRWGTLSSVRTFQSSFYLIIAWTWIFIRLEPTSGRNAKSRTWWATFLLRKAWLCIFVLVANDWTCVVSLPSKAFLFGHWILCFTCWIVMRWRANTRMFNCHNQSSFQSRHLYFN